MQKHPWQQFDECRTHTVLHHYGSPLYICPLLFIWVEGQGVLSDPPLSHFRLLVPASPSTLALALSAYLAPLLSLPLPVCVCVCVSVCVCVAA